MMTTISPLEPVADAPKIKSATRSERMTIRPFAGISGITEALDGVQLHIGGDSFESGPIVVGDETMHRAPLALSLPPAAVLGQAVKQCGISPSDCALVVIVSSRTHRASEVLMLERLTKDADYPEELVLSRQTADLAFGDRAGFKITVAVALVENLPPAPLKPHIPGTWLVRAIFNVSPERQDASFSPEELTEDVRQTYELPVGVMRFIAFDDILAADELADAVHVYVEPSVLRWMLSNETDRVAIQQQIELALLSYDATAQEIVRELRAAHQDPQRSITESDIEPFPAVHRFIDHLAAKCGCTVSDVLSMACDGQLIRPFLEASFEAMKFTLNALKD
jgi:hypothetical protein